MGGSDAEHLSAMAAASAEFENGEAARLAAVMDVLSLTVFISDSAGRVLAMTRGAEALVQAGDVLSMKQDQLRAVAPFEAASLNAALRRALTPRASGEVPESSAVLMRGTQAQLLVIDVIALPGNGQAESVAPRVLVVVRGRCKELATSQSLLQAAFGLTLAEAEIALLLTDGLTPDGIAGRRGVAVSTVRAQMRTVFTKLGVNRQAEVAARLRAFH